MRWAWAVLVLLAIAGCGKSSAAAGDPSTTGANPPGTRDPAQIVYDQVRSGFVQLDTITDTLADALTAAKEGTNSKNKTMKEACQGIADLMDSSGSYLSDYTEPPATFEEFNAKFAEYDDDRLKAIDAANDALHEVGDAKGFLEDILADPNLEKEQITMDLKDLLDQAQKDLKEAVTTLGGKVEEPTAG